MCVYVSVMCSAHGYSIHSSSSLQHQYFESLEAVSEVNVYFDCPYSACREQKGSDVRVGGFTEPEMHAHLRSVHDDAEVEPVHCPVCEAANDSHNQFSTPALLKGHFDERHNCIHDCKAHACLEIPRQVPFIPMRSIRAMHVPDFKLRIEVGQSNQSVCVWSVCVYKCVKECCFVIMFTCIHTHSVSP